MLPQKYFDVWTHLHYDLLQKTNLKSSKFFRIYLLNLFFDYFQANMQWEISFKSYQPATSKMLALPTIQLPRSWQRSMKSSKSIRNSQGKVEKIKEDGLDSIPSSSVKIQIIWGKVIVAQTWQFFDKLPEITDFGLLQQSQNRARFWIC